MYWRVGGENELFALLHPLFSYLGVADVLMGGAVELSALLHPLGITTGRRFRYAIT